MGNQSQPPIIFFDEDDRNETAKMIPFLKNIADSALSSHRHNNHRGRFHLCAIAAINDVLSNNKYAQKRFQCLVCKMVFDDFASVYFHTH